MTLRIRLTLAATVAAALAILGVAVLGVGFARHELRSEIDHALSEQAAGVRAQELVQHEGSEAGETSGTSRTSGDDGARAVPPDPLAGDGDGDGDEQPLEGGIATFQVIDASGTVRYLPRYVTPLPIDEGDIEVATGVRSERFRDATIAGRHFRMVTTSSPGGYAVQVARPITDVDETLHGLTIGFTLLAVAGIVIAGLLGLVLSRRALAPVAELSAAAKDVAATQDATLPVPETGGTELAQLGHSINTMLASLAAARDHERRLIDDAAHELRTPLTSLRTNIEMLTNERQLDDADRADLLADLRSQMEEFSTLVGDLDALARGDGDPSEIDDEPVTLDAVVTAAVRRAQRRAGSIILVTTIDEPASVRGTAAMLERAVLNILDNAVKWSPPGATVEVTLRGAEITVADAGPGIDEGDLPHVFDRFWRAPTSRSTPGSGLGLAIVRQVVDTHGGRVTVDRGATGGTLVRVTLPALEGAEPVARTTRGADR